MIFRDFKRSDSAEFQQMCIDFHNTDACLHPVSIEYISAAIEEALSNSPHIRILMLCEEEVVKGFVVLALTYTLEVGGNTVWLEEIYVKPEFRGEGISTAFINWLLFEYKDKAKRFRLEYSEENASIAEYYKKFGFEPLEYISMTIDKK